MSKKEFAFGNVAGYRPASLLKKELLKLTKNLIIESSLFTDGLGGQLKKFTCECLHRHSSPLHIRSHFDGLPPYFSIPNNSQHF